MRVTFGSVARRAISSALATMPNIGEKSMRLRFFSAAAAEDSAPCGKAVARILSCAAWIAFAWASSAAAGLAKLAASGSAGMSNRTITGSRASGLAASFAHKASCFSNLRVTAAGASPDATDGPAPVETKRPAAIAPKRRPRQAFALSAMNASCAKTASSIDPTTERHPDCADLH